MKNIQKIFILLLLFLSATPLQSSCRPSFSRSLSQFLNFIKRPLGYSLKKSPLLLKNCFWLISKPFVFILKPLMPGTSQQAHAMQKKIKKISEELRNLNPAIFALNGNLQLHDETIKKINEKFEKTNSELENLDSKRSNIQETMKINLKNALQKINENNHLIQDQTTRLPSYAEINLKLKNILEREYNRTQKLTTLSENFTKHTMQVALLKKKLKKKQTQIHTFTEGLSHLNQTIQTMAIELALLKEDNSELHHYQETVELLVPKINDKIKFLKKNNNNLLQMLQYPTATRGLLPALIMAQQSCNQT